MPEDGLRRGSSRVAWIALGLALLALVAAVFGEAGVRVLRALRHHGPERAWQEALRFEPPWRGPLVAYERVAPEDAGLDPVRLEAWSRGLAALGTEHLLVVRGGRLVHEWVAPSRRANDLVHVSAIAKGTAGAPALGALVDMGLVALDDPAWKYIPAWRDDPPRSRIRLRMLANHTSGIQNIVYGGDGAGLSGWEKAFSDDHAQRFPLTLSRAAIGFEPGSRVAYSSLAYYALSYALTAALQGSPTPDLRALLQHRVHAPLDIPPDAVRIGYGRLDEHDGLRLVTLASGAAYTPRALARIGELFAGDGTWGDRRILAAETVAALLSDAGVPSERPADQPVPALGWWRNREGFFPSLPPDAVIAAGASHRVVACVPSLDLVVVRLGEPLHAAGAGGFWDGLDARIFAPLLEAVR